MSDEYVETLAAALYSMGVDCNVKRVWERESNEGMRELFRDWARFAIKYVADNPPPHGRQNLPTPRGVPGCP